MFEVEMKFPLSDADSVVRQFTASGARPGAAIDQCDLYFNHPGRDFGKTDEALRIRTEGNRHYVTYKGPIVDSRTKTRREIEIGLCEGDAADRFAEMLQWLGFRQVRSVRKRRTTYYLAWEGLEFEIAIDEVAGLGTFLEIETQSDEAGRRAAVDAMQAIVVRFGLPPDERKSYLSLLLEKDNQIL